MTENDLRRSIFDLSVRKSSLFISDVSSFGQFVAREGWGFSSEIHNRLLVYTGIGECFEAIDVGFCPDERRLNVI